MRFNIDRSNLTVPHQNVPFGFQQPMDDGLHTPHQDVPMGIGDVPSREPTQRNEWTSYGWRNVARGFLGGVDGQWRKEDELYFDPSRPREMALGMTRDDIEYAKMSERRNRETIQKMTPRQKRLLDALEHGKIFALSKLKEVGDGL